MRRREPLTKQDAQKARPRKDGKADSQYDGRGGLFLLVTAAGKKLWRYTDRFTDRFPFITMEEFCCSEKLSDSVVASQAAENVTKSWTNLGRVQIGAAGRFVRFDLQTAIFLLTALYFLITGAHLALQGRGSYDFVIPYCGARCLVYGCDPYNPSQLQKQFVEAGGQVNDLNWESTSPVYPPTAFLALMPLAALKLSWARLIWFSLNGALFAMSVVSVLSFCPQSHRWLITVLGVAFLLNSRILLESGQPAIFAISLVAMGTVLLLCNQQILLAAFLLVLSLAVKPQIGGAVVLFLLLKKIKPLYVGLAMSGVLAILLVAGTILRERPASANWVSEMHANISDSVKPGHSSDPTLPYAAQVNVQAIARIIFANVKLSSAISYGIFIVLLAAWGVCFLLWGTDSSLRTVFLASLVSLSLLPVYHRYYDTSLLVLTIPAIVAIFERKLILGIVIAALTILENSSIISMGVPAWLQKHHPTLFHSIVGNKFTFILMLRQQSLELLSLACLYLVAIVTFQRNRKKQNEPSTERIGHGAQLDEGWTGSAV